MSQEAHGEDERVTSLDRNRPADRDDIMDRLAKGIELIDQRIATKTMEGEPDDELLIKQVRAKGYLAGQYRKLMRDSDIDEIQDELELLQEATDIQ